MSQPEQSGVSSQDLLLIIGELTTENRLLRARLEQLQQALEEKEQADASD